MNPRCRGLKHPPGFCSWLWGSALWTGSAAASLIWRRLTGLDSEGRAPRQHQLPTGHRHIREGPWGLGITSATACCSDRSHPAQVHGGEIEATCWGEAAEGHVASSDISTTPGSAPGDLRFLLLRRLVGEVGFQSKILLRITQKNT